MKKRLTVAKYQENTSWLLSLNCLDNIIIYDKSTSSVEKYNEVLDGENNIKYLKNIGRESHTYLMHIVQNYETLYDIEIFVQGKIYDHINANRFLNYICDTDTITMNGFQDFSPTRKYLSWSTSDYDEVKSLYPHSPHVGVFENPHIELYNILYGDKPKKGKYVEFGAHGIFAVTKETILRHEKSKYIKLLEFFNSEVKSAYDLLHYSYIYEHFWKVIFTE